MNICFLCFLGNTTAPKKHVVKHNSTGRRRVHKTPTVTTAGFQESSILNKDNPQAECKGETVLYNVDLKGGLTANSFRRYKRDTSMESCLGRCCDLSDCDVALIKDGDCFAVHCSTKELCEIVDGVGKLANVLRSGSGKIFWRTFVLKRKLSPTTGSHFQRTSHPKMWQIVKRPCVQVVIRDLLKI